MNAPVAPHSLTPPDDRHWGGPLALALLAHGLLAAALTWGIGWSRSSPVPVLAEAELWSRLPQSAAPREVDAAPPPEAAPPTPAPPSPATPPEPDRAAEQRALQAQRDADIALQQQKERDQREREEAQRLAEQRKKAERERAEREKAEREKAEKEKAEALKKQQAQQRELDKQKAAKAAEEAQRQALKKQQAQAAAEKAQQEKAAKAEAERLAKMRAENLQRMAGMAGASGAPGSTGTALKSSGPSATYAGRIVGAVRPNIVFTETLAGNPTAEVEVRTLPDGTIASRRLLKSSGEPAWDEAVLKALDRTARLPRDENGRVPGTLVIGFRPRD